MDKKNIMNQLDGIVIDVGASCELLSALLRMHEAYTDGRARYRLPDDLSSEYISLQIRLISEIEKAMEQLEKVTKDLKNL